MINLSNLVVMDNMIWSHTMKISGNDQSRQHRCKEYRCYKYLEEKAHLLTVHCCTDNLGLMPFCVFFIQ